MKLYVLKHKDEEILADSRSGGAFSAICSKILENGGCVYGCALNEKFEAVHTRITSVNDLHILRKSKYVQSDMKNTFLEVLQDLKEKKEVLFSGTSCQVAGILNFIKMKDESLLKRLFTVNIICYGVPSPILWRDYVSSIKQKYGEITDIQFRDKSYGWVSHYESYVVKGRKKYSQIYANLMYSDNALRRSCYHCQYSISNYPADITLADAWGVDKDCNLIDSHGASLAILNTDKGMEIMESVMENFYSQELNSAEQCYQPRLMGICNDEPEKREEFWQNYYSSFSEIVKKYGVQNDTIIVRLRRRLGWIKKKILKINR